MRKGMSAVILRQPCYREKLDDVVAFRLGRSKILPLICQKNGMTYTDTHMKGNSTQGQTRGVFPKVNWSAQDPTTRRIQLIYPHVITGVSPVLELECRMFLPGPKDEVDLKWKSNDTLRIVNIPPYAIVGLPFFWKLHSDEYSLM